MPVTFAGWTFTELVDAMCLGNQKMSQKQLTVHSEGSSGVPEWTSSVDQWDLSDNVMPANSE